MNDIRAALVFGVVLQGCAGLGHMASADTVGTGKLQVSAEPAAQLGVVDGAWSVTPRIDGSVRYGLGERVDVGARFGQSLLEGSLKVLLTPPGTRFKLSVAPSLGGNPFALGLPALGSSGSGVLLVPTSLRFTLPVLLGVVVADDTELIVAPRLEQRLVFGAEPEGRTVAFDTSAGASLGVSVAVTDGLCVVPEVAFSVPVASETAGTSWAARPTLQVTLGLVFGDARPLLATP